MKYEFRNYIPQQQIETTNKFKQTRVTNDQRKSELLNHAETKIEKLRDEIEIM